MLTSEGTIMLLNVEGVWSGYGEMVILRGVDLVVGDAETVAILGPNGVGKTTLMKTIAGALKSRRGKVTFRGIGISGMASHARAKLGLGYVPQGREIFPKLTGLENLLVGVYANNVAQERVEEVLEEFPSLRPKLNQLGAGLSGGEQQLLALARALTIRPKLLLLDEPSEGIQPSILDEIHAVLTKFKMKTGLSILLVEQNLDFANGLADRTYLMDIGRITRELARDQLLNDPTLHRDFLGGTADDVVQGI